MTESVKQEVEGAPAPAERRYGGVAVIMFSATTIGVTVGSYEGENRSDSREDVAVIPY